MRLLWAVLALCLVVPLSASHAGHWWEAGPPLPTLTGRVVDEAGLLPVAARRDLAAKLEALEKGTGHQLVIVTTPSLRGQRIDDFGIRLGRSWGIGRRGVNDGVLLIVAPAERQVRIEVGYGLERKLSDPECAGIIRNDILPSFRSGKMRDGIVAGARAIIERLGRR